MKIVDDAREAARSPTAKTARRAPTWWVALWFTPAPPGRLWRVVGYGLALVAGVVDVEAGFLVALPLGIAAAIIVMSAP